MQNFVRSYWGVTLLLAIGWQLLMTLIGVIAANTFGEAGQPILAHTAKWDGGWYLSIINGSYSDLTSPSPVFYPLFPFAVYLAQTITLHAIDPLALALVINTAALWLALAALLKIAESFVPRKYTWWAIGLFLTSPAAFFMHMFYSEALFCAMVFWAYLFALRRQWAAMAILLALATSARLPAVLFVGLCALEFLRAHEWRIRNIINPNLLWFLLVPAGFVAYGLYLALVRGDFLAMFHSYDLTQDWTYHVFDINVFYPVLKGVYAVFLAVVGARPFDSEVIVSAALPVLGLAVLLATSLYAIYVQRGKSLPLGIFGILSAILFTVNNNVVSLHRYLLPCLSIYIVTMLALRAYARLQLVLYGVMYVGILFQAYLIFLSASGRFAG